MSVINRIKIIAAKIPLKHNFMTSRTVQAEAKSIFVELETDEGTVGIGESTPKRHVTGEDLDSAFIIMKNIIAPLYLHQDTKLALKLSEKANRVLELNPSAKIAFDMACYDINSKESGLPLYKFINGKKKGDIFLNGHIDLSVDNVEDWFENTISKRFHHNIKLKLGSGIDNDKRRLLHLRTLLEPEIRIIGDVNQAWTLRESLDVVKNLESSINTYIEQPLYYRNLSEMRELNSFSKVPIMADESMWTASDAKSLIDLNVCSMLNIKLMKAGSIAEAIQTLEFAESKGVSCMIGSTIETSLSVSVEMALAFKSDCVKFLDSIIPDEELLVDPIRSDFKITGDSFSLSEKRGLGCSLDIDLLEEYIDHYAEINDNGG